MKIINITGYSVFNPATNPEKSKINELSVAICLQVSQILGKVLIDSQLKASVRD